jgi:hypothetical protein
MTVRKFSQTPDSSDYKWEDRKILQIIPADGWGVVFLENETEVVRPLVCWALADGNMDNDSPCRHVAGMCAMDESFGYDELFFCVEDESFVGYRKINS